MEQPEHDLIGVVENVTVMEDLGATRSGADPYHTSEQRLTGSAQDCSV